jgi:hypothetical protein
MGLAMSVVILVLLLLIRSSIHQIPCLYTGPVTKLTEFPFPSIPFPLAKIWVVLPISRFSLGTYVSPARQWVLIPSWTAESVEGDTQVDLCLLTPAYHRAEGIRGHTYMV